MKRRNFVKAAAAAAIAPQVAIAAEPKRREPLSGIQIAPFSILDEGLDRCLDTLQSKAAVNALFIYSQSYYPGYTSRQT